jgi:glycosyltransferase involved in cell wall biosynthesis
MRSYIIIASPGYGGAEKRFFDICMSLRSEGVDVMIIAPSSLIQQFLADHSDQKEVAKALISIKMKTWSRFIFVIQLLKLLWSLPRNANYHYPLNCLWPLHFRRGDKVSMSVAYCIQVPGPFSSSYNMIWTWISFFFVTKIDVLSPAILSAMAGYRCARKMSLTPGGTFLMPPINFTDQKKPIIVFFGRLVAKKGIDDFLDVLPQVWATLCERMPEGFSFKIAGYGPLEEHVTKRVAALVSIGVPIVFVGYADAYSLLADTAIVLSMQEITNYPSRIIAEALVLGCAVIVRDTGDSRQFGNDLPGLVYCDCELKPTELAGQIEELVNRILHDTKYSKEISEAARQRFSSKAYIDYYRSIISPECMTILK